MAVRRASAAWNGGLLDGSGKMRLGSGAFEGPFSFKTRFEEEPGTNPEELIGAAHAGCFSMAFAATLGKNGFAPERVATDARVHLTKGETGFSISKIELHTEATVPGIDEAKFQELATAAKNSCPVSRALAAIEIELHAKLA
ncbi:MAG: OsmC family protein [Thermoanaerobaculia bacterium]|nr:OsmC family protein [Thermoanaerobaculia bacterium]MDI9631284.1 OsmC family protein [Acidobacteriota bacterium]MBP7812037.1 OsmC family protein [Thermoanaerobaculia bacterium]HPA95174.1 OsmC family protein [Thermoanaerobaculia bacterium]HQN37933.1 OsmC family protein [Thermoanaerobaculia bacterium]